MTLDWPLIGENLINLLLVTGTAAGIMYPIRRAIARKSPKDAFVGWFGYGFAVANCFGWGLPALNTPRGLYHGTGSLIGLGFGLVLGLGIGTFLWHHYRRQTPEE